MTRRFEAAWAAWNGAGAVATASWTGGRAGGARSSPACAARPCCVRRTPSWPLRSRSWRRAGARSSWTATATTCARRCATSRPSCAATARRRSSSCTSAAISPSRCRRSRTLCAAEGVFLIEDCAHAHGAQWHGRRPGTWGDAGVYSFYATKTVSTGEGGVLVSRRDDVREFAAYRNYGKPDHRVAGLNFRMSEFTAALALVQTERMEEIVAAKNAVSARAPRSCSSRTAPAPGHDGLRALQVHRLRPHRALDRQGLRRAVHRIMGTGDDLPNGDWVGEHHWCAPLYFHQATNGAHAS